MPYEYCSSQQMTCFLKNNAGPKKICSYIGNLKHLNCEIIYSSLLLWWQQLRLKVNFSNSTIFMISENDPRKKKVAEIELYHTLTLIFSQPQQVVNKYFSHKPHWWSCVGWRKQSHSIHWQDIILQVFTMVCLIFHTVIIINKKKMENNYKTSFWKSQQFFKKANVRIC